MPFVERGKMKFKDLILNEKNRVTVLITSIEERKNKNGSLYLRVYLSDGETQIFANLWDHSKEKFEKNMGVGKLMSCDIVPKMYMDSVSYEIRGYGPAPADADIGDFIIKSPIEPEIIFEKLLSLADHLHSVYKDLIYALFEKYRKQILNAAAGKNVHHNYIGGFLYHTYRMTQSALRMADIYPIINKELLVAGCILHDIGKMEEMVTDSLGNSEYTTDGNLLGHSLQGILMIQKAAIGLGTQDTEEVRLLLHLIASHHGVAEYGAIRTPSIPEAMILNHLDMIDSRIDIFERTYREMDKGETSDKIFGLDCRVYKSILP